VPAASVRTRPLQILQSEVLRPIPGLVHGFSTRLAGYSRVYGGNALNLSFTSHDNRSAVERNRSLFLQKLQPGGPKPSPLITLRQIHSGIVHAIDHPPRSPLAGDGMITDTPGVLLGILTADCIPVLLADEKRRAIGVFHAGWRGTVKRIVQKGVGEMHRHFGSKPPDIRAAIGPGIHSCCYQVGPEVREHFQSQFDYADELFREEKSSDVVREKYPLLFLTARAPGHSELPTTIFLDLIQANRRQLLDAGLPANKIWSSPLCTSCRTDLLFSHRAEHGVTGRMMAVAGILGGRQKSSSA
jgi:YfiH family protein